MKSISIAMATYNGARFIGEQLESLARQTVLPDELVVTDDCSTDGTLDIVREFAARMPFPVRIEKNPKRLGYRANFMKAAALCRSDLIAFCDQDDVWEPGKLKACREIFAHKDVLLAYHNATVVTEDLKPVGEMKSAALRLTINPPSSLDPWTHGAWGFTMVFDRVLLKFHKLWRDSIDIYEMDQREKHDQWFYFMASCLGSVAYLDEPLALYRQHGQNTIGYKGATTLRGKFNILIANDLDGMKARIKVSRNRAEILEQAQKMLRDRYRARARLAAAGYRKLEASYQARCEMYALRNIFMRSYQLVTLSRAGGYRPRHQWGVGRQALIRDILRGVFFPSGKHYKKRSTRRAASGKPARRQRALSYKKRSA